MGGGSKERAAGAPAEALVARVSVLFEVPLEAAVV